MHDSFYIDDNSRVIAFSYHKGFRVFFPQEIILLDYNSSNWADLPKKLEELKRKIPKPRNKLTRDEEGKRFFLTVQLTTDCNLKCDYCYLHGINAEWPDFNNRLPSKNLTKHIITTLREKNIAGFNKFYVNFFGGEPLLFKDTLQSITKALRNFELENNISITIGVTTNGTLLDDSFLSFCLSSNINILLSLDSPPELQNKYRAHHNKFASFHDILKRIHKAIESISIVCTMTKQTSSIRSSLKHILNLHPKKVSFNFVHTKNKELALDANDATRFCEEILREEKWFAKYANKIGNISDIHAMIEKRSYKDIPCDAGNTAITISSNGLLYFCHGCTGRKEFKLNHDGTLHKDTQKILAQATSSYDHCNTCWARWACGGDCWLIRTEFPQEDRLVRCKIIKALTRLGLATFIPNKNCNQQFSRVKNDDVI